MPRIIRSPDCGNSPKNGFVEDIAIALETGICDPETFDPAVTWESTSTRQIVGRTAVLEALSTEHAPAKVIVEYAISHGRVGAASSPCRVVHRGPVQMFLPSCQTRVLLLVS